MSNGIGASFRDPSGFIFTGNGEIYRQINSAYQGHYSLLFQSGLYAELTGEELLVAHREAPLSLARTNDACAVILPERVPFISYPYEWCFSQLKDAALCTLRIQKKALARNMSLKDASAYNIQFLRGKPVLIDTLSFETYREGSPWVAYRQFCQHFLAPLALMAYRDTRLGQLLRIQIDGIPLDLASMLLPPRARLRPSLFFHLRLHAGSQKRFANRSVAPGRFRMSRHSFLALIDSLESAIAALKPRHIDSEWGDYYRCTHYTPGAREHKAAVVENYLERLAPKTVWDLAGNTGFFGRIAARRGISTVSFDADHTAVEKGYEESTRMNEKRLLPLLLDLTNPSAGIGWNNGERMSLIERGPADTVLALALIHHLAIGNNVPLRAAAEFFARTGRSLIIEFVPKSDAMTQRLLASREDIFGSYTLERFIDAFSRHFRIDAQTKLAGSERVLFMMRSRGLS